ncbi:sulfate ABC transporter permease subunit CysW [Leptospira sp. GIMC2001]|uniref:sulfate ABC transporter permease subunit CysW n=1 Tax=Leptospira sp. GIMC2001 TaxID=1513297 RepID=UPI002349EB4D|nr:sulfate ABC transporter permease subunit CysW [Leptospira sp. GIMC2001]WCL49241.1 sulfate ABC transporter permease subunit CysW [Leptospira sp. GIMC2001]
MNRTESRWIKYSLVGIVYFLSSIILFLPLINVFTEAFADGVSAYIKGISASETITALWLSIKVAAISVPINTVFGIIAAFLLTRFTFVGKNILMTIIDSPFAVSPVISGLIFLLIFGKQGWMSSTMESLNLEIVFNTPGLIIATCFITLPFVVRELIPLMESQGKEEEEAGLLLGASMLQTFIKIIVPNIKWGLVYGIILCNARAMGEFGAVSVLSGHIRGKTNTLPLEVEMMYNEYNSVGAFSAASLLVFLSLGTLIIKFFLEKKIQIESPNNKELTK